MKLIIDVFYQDKTAKVVGGFFENWEDDKLIKISSKNITDIKEYISGEFYKRELPCILAFLSEYKLEDIELIIIDGFVFLGDNDKKGLGAWLFDSLYKKTPIIGVAKSKFQGNTKNVKEVFRGKSKNALFVSAIGIELFKASAFIKNMKGDYRLPKLLKLVDTETKRYE